MTTGPFTPERLETFIRELASAGIAVYPTGSSTPKIEVDAPSPMALTEAQASNAALGVWEPSGMTGAQLDDIAKTEPLEPTATSIPASLLVAAWAHSARSPASALALRYLGNQDLTNFSSVVFPAAVMALFTADVTAAAGPVAPQGALPAADPSGDSACEQFKGFIFGTIDRVFTAIGHIQLVGLSGDFFRDILPFIRNVGATLGNLAIDSVHFVVVNGVKVALGPIINGIAAVAGVLGVATTIVTTLQPWTGQIIPEPLISRRDAAAHPGIATLRVHSALTQNDWPTEIAGCARAAGVELPSLQPRDADVTWKLVLQQPGPMIEKVSDSGPLGRDSTARMSYSTLAEPPDVAQGEERTDGIVFLDVLVHRKDLDKLQELLSGSILKLLPDIVAKAVGPQLLSVIDPQVKALLKPLATLRDVTVQGVIPVNYHVLDPDKEPGPTDSVRLGVVPGTCPSSMSIGHGYHSLDNETIGPTVGCNYEPGDGFYLLTVGLSPFREKFSDYPGAKRIELVGADEAWIDDLCTVASVGPCFELRANVGDRSLSIIGAPSDEVIVSMARHVLGVA